MEVVFRKINLIVTCTTDGSEEMLELRRVGKVVIVVIILWGGCNF